MSSSFPSFVAMVRRKINNKLAIPFMRQLYQDEVDAILSHPTLNQQAQITLLTDLLRGLKIPLGVEGAGMIRLGLRPIRG